MTHTVDISQEKKEVDKLTDSLQKTLKDAYDAHVRLGLIIGALETAKLAFYTFALEQDNRK